MARLRIRVGQIDVTPPSRGRTAAERRRGLVRYSGLTGILAPMSTSTHPTAQSGASKTARNPVKVIPVEGPLPKKPPWIRVRAPVGPEVTRLKGLLREQRLVTVCEEASCPNLGECFSHGTATFMVMGELCTRRCPFCDVAHGRPDPLDPAEPLRLATTVERLGLRHVVITSVDRDDLRDGGAGHFASCVRAVRGRTPSTRIEILVPDFPRKDGAGPRRARRRAARRL